MIKTIKNIYLGGDNYVPIDIKPIDYMVTGQGVTLYVTNAMSPDFYHMVGRTASRVLTTNMKWRLLGIGFKNARIYTNNNQENETWWLPLSQFDELLAVSTKTGGVLRHLYTGLKHLLATRKVVLV